jgi:hypothetical protein
MEEFLLFIEENQIWIYVTLATAGLIYLRLLVLRIGEFQRTFFGLERERARARLTRAGTMFGLVLVGFIAVFVITTFAGPSLPISSRTTPAPTVSFLSTPDENDSVGGEVELATPIGDESPSNLGCSNQDATVQFPQDGETISGRIDILGVADIPGFAFYKLEIRAMTLEAVWRAIAAGTQPVCGSSCDDENILGTWDTSLVTPGEYEFRLVVMDTVGNAPMPCTIKLRVLPDD